MEIPFKNFQGKHFYSHQIQALKFTQASQRRVVAINSPVGSGKTVIGASIIPLSHGPISYLCSSKMLQDQIEGDFSEAALLKGRANYMCPYLQDQVQYRSRGTVISADDCVGAKRCPKEFQETCPYRLQKAMVKESEFKVLNYQYFLAECQTVKSVFSNLSPWVVCDEADLLDTILVNAISFVISRKAMERYNLPPPDMKTKLWAYHEWIIEAVETLARVYNRLDLDLEEYTKDYPPPIELVREHRRVENLLRKLNFLCTELDPNWIAEWDEDKLTFKPVWLTPALIQNFFMHHVPRLLLMSGTLPPKPVLCGLLHFDPNDVDYLELPHTFPIRNRLVYYKPVVNMTRETMKDPQTIRTLADEINNTLNQFLGRGVIHTVSYTLAQALKNAISGPNSKRLLIHNSQDKDEVLREYFQTPGAVLLSPSCERGLDLKGDLGTFCGWAKCPYLSLADKQTAARAYASGKWGKLWYRSMAAMAIEQGSGRTTRTPTDKGVTFLWDEQIGKLLRETSLWHVWFRKSIVYGGFQ
jgi:Rad3-related DNA helicase